jgi:hypothetical protein
VLDLRGFEPDAAWSVLRDGAVAREVVAEALRGL